MENTLKKKSFLSSISRGMNEDGSRKGFYFLYTVLFTSVLLAVFATYIFTDKSLIYNGDGWNQHYKALLYYSEYLRAFFKKIIFEHSFGLPEFGFSIGEGADILETLHYYVIGDPFAFFSFLCPAQYLNYYLEISIFARIYVAGIVFCEFCFYKGNKNRMAVITGAIIYVFCMWTIFVSARHPYFINPMINYPLLIFGVEKILRKDRPYLFIIAVMITAVSNFYFLYMLVLLTIIYVAVRLMTAYICNTKLKGEFTGENLDFVSGFKDIIKWVFEIAKNAVIGMMMAGVIVAPIVYAFLASPRMNVAHNFSYAYRSSYMRWLPASFVTSTTNSWTCMGFAVIVLVSIVLLFKKKRDNVTSKILFLFCIGAVSFPMFGQVMNGMSYVANRWTFAIAFLVGYIYVVKWEDLSSLKKKDYIPIAIVIAIYYGFCFVTPISSRYITLTQVTILTVYVFINAIFTFSTRQRNYRPKSALALVFVILSIAVNATYKYSPECLNYAAVACNDGDFITVKENESMLVEEAARQSGDEGLYPKYTGKDLDYNSNIFSRTTSTSFFWSISTTNAANYRYRDLMISNGISQKYKTLTERTALLETTSIKYFTKPANNKSAVPFGYKKLDINTGIDSVDEGYIIYENEYALPIAYCYDSYMLLSDWLKLDITKRQEAMLQSAIMESYDGDVETEEETYTSKNIDYTVTPDEAVSVTDGKIYAYEDNAQITLKFNGLDNAETYVVFNNLYVKRMGNFDTFGEFTLKASNRQTRKFMYYLPDHSYYSNQHDFVVNMGYKKDGITYVKITLPLRGEYTFDSIDIICQPMDNFEEQAKALKENVLENIEYGEDAFGGTIDLDDSRILCITIPFTAGWSATVDGKKAEILKVNDYYMGLDLDEGHHEISLTYKTPLLRAGALMSLMGIGAFAVLVLITEKKRKKI